MKIRSNADTSKTQIDEDADQKRDEQAVTGKRDERKESKTLCAPNNTKAGYANHPYGPNARPADDRYIAPRPMTSTRKRGMRISKKEKMLAKRRAC
jgi:hypothetical protein